MTNLARRPRLLVVAAILLAVVGVTSSGFGAATEFSAASSEFRLQVSEHASRLPAADLDGATVQPGAVYVFAEGAPAGATVLFWIDRASDDDPDRSEFKAPYDLLGDVEGAPRPLDTRRWQTGSHVIEAVAVKGGEVVAQASATFVVGKAPIVSATGAPAPSATGVSLFASADVDRDPATALEGTTVAATLAYIFAEGVPDGSTVVFTLTSSAGTTTVVEGAAPYDLMGDEGGTPRPLSTWPGAVGAITLVATASIDNQVVGVGSATFSVGTPVESAPVSPTATPSSQPASPSTTLPATTTVPKPVPAAPARPAGYPDAANTGVPGGKTLRSVGKVTVTEPGAVLDGLLISCLDVEADNVTVVNSRIECDRNSGAVINSADNLTIRDSEVDGLGRAGNCVVHSGYTLDRVDVTGCSDGLRANGDVVIKNSYVHDLIRLPGSHNDAIQTTKGSNIVITGNTLLPYNAGTRDPMNSAYILKEDQGPISDVTFVGNYVNGGNYTLYIIGDQDMSSLVFTDNVFGRDFRYGAVGDVPNQVTWRNNVFRDNGAAVN